MNLMSRRAALAVGVLTFGLGLHSTGWTQAPGRGGTAVVVVPADPGHFNPAISTGAFVHAVADSLYNSLVELGPDLEPQPDLAVSWTIGDAGARYTFKLAPGVRWHDGEAFTSADVKFTFEEILLKHHARAKAGLGAVIAAIETPAADTVVFRLRRPYGAFLRLLGVTEAPILPRHRYEGVDPLKSPVNLKPIGTGPFRFESYRTDQQTVLARNLDYFKPGLPYLERLVFRVIPDPSSQAAALLAGEADYVGLLNAADVERMRSRQDIVVAQSAFGPGGGNCIMTLAFNLERKSVGDIRVRQAIAYAIDRAQMLRLVLFGLGKVSGAPISSGLPWAHAPGTLASYATPDVRLSAELLDAAGLKADAQGMRLAIDMPHFPTFSRYGELIRQNLARAGIRVNQRVLDRAAFVDAVFGKRDFDVTPISYCNGADPDSGVRRMYVSDNIGNVPFSNAAAYRNPEVDRLFAAAGASPDVAERSRSYALIQEAVARDLPYWWLVETVVMSAWRSNLAGFRPWTGQFAERAFVRPP